MLSALTLFLVFVLVPCASPVHAEGAEGPDLGKRLLWNETYQIPLAALEAYIDSAPAYGQAKLMRNPQRLLEVIRELYLNRYLADEARESGLLADPLEQARLENKISQHLAGLRTKQLREQAVPDMAALAGERYRLDPTKYKMPDRVRVAHVMIRESPDPELNVIEFAESVRQRALAGEDFEKLAREYSADPTVKTNGGDLGLQEQGMFEEAFGEAAFALENPGDIGPVVRTKYGLHVIKLIERAPGRQLSFEEAREGIVEQLTASHRQARHEDYIANLKEQAEFEIDDDLLLGYVKYKLEALGAEPPPAPPPQAD